MNRWRWHFASCVAGLAVIIAPVRVAAQAVTLSETFEPTQKVRTEVKTDLIGRLPVPGGKPTDPPRLAELRGTGTVVYDERPLKSDDPQDRSLLRMYRTIEYRRSVGEQTQTAGLRPTVRRVVVLRSAKGKSPFSPDGPLTWGEIDTLRTDTFAPALVPGLLPKAPVGVGDSWPASTEAVIELTDMEKVESGGFKLKLVGLVTINGKQQARLAISGSAKGVDDDGPCQHTVEGVAYFDMAAQRLAYLSFKGTHELLDGSGKTAGVIEGKFTMNRSEATATDLTETSPSDFQPTAENTLLLYDNRDMGLRFIYSRRWRVGAVQGRQLTLDGPNNAGILLTLEAPGKVPTAKEFLAESLDFLKKQKSAVSAVSGPERLPGTTIDRFGLDTELAGEKIRMAYGVMTATTGGVTVAARLPREDAAILGGDVEKLLKSLAIGK